MLLLYVLMLKAKTHTTHYDNAIMLCYYATIAFSLCIHMFCYCCYDGYIRHYIIVEVCLFYVVIVCFCLSFTYYAVICYVCFTTLLIRCFCFVCCFDAMSIRNKPCLYYYAALLCLLLSLCYAIHICHAMLLG